MKTLTGDDAPDIWPQCDCGVAYVFRRGLSFTRGMIWFWQADCKHPKRETHTAILMTKDGPHVNPT